MNKHPMTQLKYVWSCFVMLKCFWDWIYYPHVETCLRLVQVCLKLGHFYMWFCYCYQRMWGVIVSNVLWLVDHVWVDGIWAVFGHGATFKWCFTSLLAFWL